MVTEFKSWIDLSIKAPSGDNCQPWDFTFLDDRFRISINHLRTKHYLDQNESAAWISIGCLWENLSRSAEQFGFSCSMEIESNQSIMVNYERVSPVSNEDIKNDIINRHTFRGKLNNAVLNLADYSNLYKSLPGSQRYQWKTVKDISRQLIWKWSELEALLWLKTPLMQDFAKWLHSKNEKSEDGITLENLQVSLMDSLSLMSFKKIPSLIRLIPFYFFELKTFLRLKFLIEKSSGLLLLSGPFKEYQDYFYAGMEIQRMWLFMTHSKIKSQPLTIQSLFLNFTNSQVNQQILSSAQIQKMEDVKERTYDHFNIDKNQNLIFAFRFGQTTEVIPRLPRRKVIPSSMVNTLGFIFCFFFYSVSSQDHIRTFKILRRI